MKSATGKRSTVGGFSQAEIESLPRVAVRKAAALETDRDRKNRERAELAERVQAKIGGVPDMTSHLRVIEITVTEWSDTGDNRESFDPLILDASLYLDDSDIEKLAVEVGEVVKKYALTKGR